MALAPSFHWRQELAGSLNRPRLLLTTEPERQRRPRRVTPLTFANEQRDERNLTISLSTLGSPTLALPTMATPVISRPTSVDSSPLLTIGDEKPDRDGGLGQATKLSTALGEATADQQDTSDSDDQDLDGEKKLEVQADKIDSDDEALQGEKDVEVQADTKDKPRTPRPRPRPILVPRPQPRLQPPADVASPDAAPNGTKRLAAARQKPAASTKHGTGSTKAKGKDAKKQQKAASGAASRKADVGSETAAADAGAHDKSCLPFRRNDNGPRKGGKQKEKGALGRAYEKVRLIHNPQTCLTWQPTSWFLESIHDPASPL